MRLFGPFVVLMLVEIALFITLGGWMGLWLSLAVIFGTAFLGAVLLRGQSQRMALDLRAAMARMSSPLSPMAHHALILFAGILLILPGFLGDTIGLLLLIPPLRRELIALLARYVPQPPRDGFGTHPGARPDVVIDAEFIELDDTAAPPRSGPSGWTRH